MVTKSDWENGFDVGKELGYDNGRTDGIWEGIFVGLLSAGVFVVLGYVIYDVFFEALH